MTSWRSQKLVFDTACQLMLGLRFMVVQALYSNLCTGRNIYLKLIGIVVTHRRMRKLSFLLLSKVA